jgi:cytochrome c oxidase accessory protein FixG
MTVQTADNVLSTLASDGSRKWIYPRVSQGRLLVARRAVAYFLMALFLALPFLHVNGKPAVLLDIVHRRFTLFGYTFLPTDTFLLALLMLFIFVSIFLFTAVMGRLWCGWACPQTVYMEFLYRPLERLFYGTIGRGGKAGSVPAWRRAAYFVAAFVVTAIPVHTFLAYFVGVEQLSRWVRQSPLDHPTAFLVMAVTTALMMFDFYWFREQLCMIACPYGRFQSVLLDKWSLIVSYDKKRGEPRGKKSHALKVLGSEPALRTQNSELATQSPELAAGDCVDCKLCVTTCPTGIDIRNGLQMECINCTQCIDACNAVMRKLERPEGLIRYSSQAAIAGEKPARFRFRLVFYPVILTILAAVWLLVFLNKGPADVTLLRNLGNPFAVLPSGHVTNSMRVKITNRSDEAADYTLQAQEKSGITIEAEDNPVHLAAGQSVTVPVLFEAEPRLFSGGTANTTLHIRDGKTFSRDIPVRLLGPANVQEPTP